MIKNLKIKIIIALIALFLPLSSWAAEPVLVKDINPGLNGSMPSNFIVIGDKLFFTADNGINGTELWKSDGTASGTVLVKDIYSGATSSYPRQLVSYNGQVFFTADDGVSGTELWKSDGTASGTVLVKDLNPGSGGSSISNLISFNGYLYFFSEDDGNLYRSDGTALGTVATNVFSAGNISSTYFLDISYNRSIGIYKNKLVFEAIYTDSQSSQQYAVLVSSDGTYGGSSIIYTSSGDSFDFNASNFYVYNDILYFQGYDAINSAELWATDGTASGTLMLKDINPGTNYSYPVGMTGLGSRVYFWADNGINGKELWQTDGTASGTSMLKDIRPVGSSYYSSSDQMQGSKAIYKNPDYDFFISDNKLYFTATDGVNGAELWVSDGTASGTLLYKDIKRGSAGSSPRKFSPLNDKWLFSYSSASVGFELMMMEFTPPSIPAALTATSQTTTSSVLTWSAATDNVAVSHYIIYRDGVAIATTSALNIIDTALLPNTTYTYRVSAVDTARNESTSSAPYQITTLATVPANLILEKNSRDLLLAWSGAQGSVFLVDTPDSNWSPATSYTLANFRCGTTYTFMVKSRNIAQVETDYSSPISITTDPCATTFIPPTAPTISIPAPITITPTTGFQGTLSVSGVANAKYIVVSTRPDFSQSSWELYTDTYKLADKTKGKVYVKFRSKEGGETKPVEVTIPTYAPTNQPSNNSQSVVTPLKSTMVKPTPKPQAIKYVILTVNLAPGSKHEQVKQLQLSLVKQGLLNPRDVVGVYGPKTTTAVKAFQKKNNLPQTGTVGPLTRQSLRNIKIK
jgi:ELWxxDGT repeat protein